MINKYFTNKIILFMVYGSIYMNIEMLVRAVRKQMVGYIGIQPLSLMGYTSIWMFFIAGFCCIVISFLNDNPIFYSKKIWQKMIFGGTLITLIELFSGLLFNRVLRLNLWSYTGKYQFLNQIELKNCILWYLLIPVIIWFDDVFTYYLYGEGEVYSLWSLYVKLFKLQ